MSRYRLIDSSRRNEFIKRGHDKKYFFPHKFYYLPKSGPDGIQAADFLLGNITSNHYVEVVLYALPPLLDKFPQDLFFDKKLVWHQQHYYLPGHIATADFVVFNNTIYLLTYLSDTVQRIACYPQYQSSIKRRFKGWLRCLINAVLNYAVENKINTIYSPRADFRIQFTDPDREVKLPFFQRIYDQTLLKTLNITKEGNWWRIDLDKNLDKIILANKVDETLENKKIISLSHDIDSAIDKETLNTIAQMEKDSGIKANYHIPIAPLNDLRQVVESQNHSCSFIAENDFFHKESENALPKCRKIDYRVKGVKKSQYLQEGLLNDDSLKCHNFEWIVIPSSELNANSSTFEKGLIKIPIHIHQDAFGSKQQDFTRWEEAVHHHLKTNTLTVIDFPIDLVSDNLDAYKQLLREISQLGSVKTFDEISAEIFFRHAL